MARPKTHHRTKLRSRTLPWGYRVDKHDPQIIEPIPELVELLDVAERAWKAKTASQPDIARWLTDRADKAGWHWPITALGLRKRLFVTPKNIKKHAIYDK